MQRCQLNEGQLALPRVNNLLPFSPFRLVFQPDLPFLIGSAVGKQLLSCSSSTDQ